MRTVGDRRDTVSKLLALLLLASGVLFSCTSSPNIPIASADSDAKAKMFIPRQGKANLYVAQSSGDAATFDITVDGKEIGPIGPGTYYLVEADPGRHSIAASSQLSSSKVTVDAESGRNYYYEVTATSNGMAATPSLSLVLIEDMGKLMVRQNQRAQIAGE
jgi:outer membrane lipoprotein-sorting protein